MNEPWRFASAGYITGQHAPGIVTSTKQHCRFLTSDAEEEAASDVDDDDEEASIFPLSRFSFPPSKDLKKLPSGVKAISMAPVSQEVPAVLPSEKIFFEDKCKYPYLVTHHQILAHAKAVKLYREEYQCHQKGKIGIVLVSQHFIPMDDSEKNTKAAQRATDFMLGWFMDPLVYGKYPENMRKYVTEGHLPKFGADKCVVKGSFDFIGLNYYTARYVTYQNSCGGNYVADQRAKFHVKGGEVYIGDEKGAGGWIYAYPKGILDLLVYIKEKYNNPLIYITENGIDDPDDDSLKLWKSIYEERRIHFLHDHLSFVREAKRRGVNVKGFFIWSLLDNFELDGAFKSRFGVIYVDYKNGSKRIPKLSASWFKHFLEN